MARVTVEDCVEKIPNRFEMILVASKRTRQLYSGMAPQVDRDNDKNTVISLREIAEGYITRDILSESDFPVEEEAPSISNDGFSL